jgi:hypothetical protein
LAAGSPKAPLAVRVSLSLPLRSATPPTGSPAKRKSSGVAATAATFSTEGLEHEFALPADVGRRGLAKKERAFEVVLIISQKRNL